MFNLLRSLSRLQMQGGGKNVPPWAIALIVLSSSALAGVFIIAAGYALQALGVTDGSGAVGMRKLWK